MRIQHNIPAMNSYRNYTNNTSALSKNLEKLSSGYKVNRAGDDAAGLAISEKMRAQITGLDAAQKNAKDGVSLVQTAEGALTEVHDMLNRMVYLATQSANGTYDDTIDRAALNEEVTQLNAEIDRIAETANFNGTKLLDGTFSGTFQIGDTNEANNQLTVTISKMDSATIGSSIDISDLSGAQNAITALKGDLATGGTNKGAINLVSEARAKLGAVQNRLEHTINNLGVMEENIQDAESTIRDTDVAEEMMDYTKNNILIQSAQAMLAQANMMPQGVLQLLQ